jgi:glycosyltransferase involved in cell wall biosynthesis
MIEKITPLILTYNEEPNIDRTLQQLTWAQEIVIIDSYSNDRTLDMLKSDPKVKIFQRKFDTHAQQWNYGLEQVESEWILSLDADYLLTEPLIETLKSLNNPAIDGYSIPFKYCVFGKPLLGTILPPRLALFKKANATYIDDGHTQCLKLQGQSSQLDAYIHHDDRKPLSRWLWAQDRYMVIEAKKLLATPDRELSWGDRLRKRKVFAPFIILIYCLILKGGIFDGWEGWYYAFQRMLAELLLAIHTIEADNLAKNPHDITTY